MKDIALKLAALLVVATMVVAGGWLWFAGDDVDIDYQQKTIERTGVPPVGSGISTPFYVEFQDPSYDLAPLDYTLPLTEDQIKNLNDIGGLTEDQMEFILTNGMVGLSDGRGFKSFSEAYEYIQKRAELPTFITSDSVLDAYHHIFEGVLIELEQDDLSEMALTMAKQLMWASHAQMAALPTEHQELARLNVVYFGVALKIFDPDAEVPDYALAEVEEIMELIDTALGKKAVAGFYQEEDFTQYKPRGHYTRSEELSRYFKGMMWFGRITFQGAYDDEARRAVLAAVALGNDEDAWDAYIAMSQVIDFMVGQPDDLTVQEVLGEVDVVMGVLVEDMTPLFDDAKLETLQTAIGKLRAPKINSDINDEYTVVWGMRIFGQRYVPDSYIFQECVYAKVVVLPRLLENQRLMPSCIDVFAVMGSEEAWGREDFARYAPDLESQMTRLKGEFDAYPDEVWSSTLYSSWLHSLKSLHESVQEERGPAFMQTRAWSAKELNTQAASWTQLTHDTILYRKQSYTDVYTTSVPPPPAPSEIVYVEPIPELYSRLIDIVEATTSGLESLGFGSDLVFQKLSTYNDILVRLERVAIDELEGKVISSDDRSALKGFYNRIRSLNKMGDGEEDTKTILVSDVHTDPNYKECLQEAVGPVRLMFVIIPTAHGNYAAMGGVFEHYEFKQPMSNRLTDEQWDAMLKDGSAPEPAPWAKQFNP